MDKYAAIARITIYNLPNNKRFCGKQLQGRFCFPQGTFEAVICTPELIYLINSGIKFEIHEIVWYYHSYFLKDYIETTYENRLNAMTKIEKDLFKLCFQMGSRIVAMETKQNRSFSGINFAPQWVHST